MSSSQKHLQTGNPEREFEAGEAAGQGQEARSQGGALERKKKMLSWYQMVSGDHAML